VTDAVHIYIRAWRKRAGISKADLARECKVEWNTVHRWESGRSHPKPEHMRAVAIALDTTVPSLYAMPEGDHDH